MLQVKEQLGGLARQAAWAAPAPANDFGLPSFSAYPGPAVAGAGEYLMMLPQLLDGALDASEGDEDSGVDGDWLDKVCGSPPACQLIRAWASDATRLHSCCLRLGCSAAPEASPPA